MFTYILSISLLCSVVVSERKYHIIPSVSDFCPEEPCLTLSQFADNSNIYTDSNTTTLIFTSGTHSFKHKSLVSIEYIDTISMLSYTSSTISLLWVSFTSVVNVFISNLTFIHCNLQFDSVETLAVENCTFFNNTLTVLELERSSAYITNSLFISNSGSPQILTINNSSHSYSTGAAIIMRSLSTFVCKNCSFYSNHADVGGVVFAKLHSNLTFINCSFVANSARKHGGVLYSEKFCTVSIHNCSFHNNLAINRGGVFALTQTNIFIKMCAFSDSESKEGGVIYAEMGLFMAAISGSNFTNNLASSMGGVLRANHINVTISDYSKFTNNVAALNGGVMYIDSGHVRVRDSIFSNCTAKDNGGVIASLDSTITIQRSVFHHNKVSNDGGVIYVGKKYDRGSIIIIESDFVNNSAFGGGVLRSQGIDVSFFNCSIVKSNRAGLGGVLLIEKVDQVIVYGSLLSNNTADTGGALLLSNNSIADISNSQLSGNSADDSGGAVYMEINNSTFTNCNFDSNMATKTGGAISAQSASYFELSTSILRNNFAQNGAGIFCSDKSSIVTSNIIVTQNSATKQGILYFIESTVTFTHNTRVSDNVGSLFFFYSDVIFKGKTIVDSCTSKEVNLTTLEGGAVTAFQSIVNFEGLSILRDNSASKGGAIRASSSKLYVHGSTFISNNTARDSGGGIYLHQSELNCEGKSILELLSNNAIDRGGGIHAISSTITAESRFSHSINDYAGSKVRLIDNRAEKIGGGICLENNAKVKVFNLEQSTHKQAYTVKFQGNSAEFGGALYVADDTTSGTCASASYQTYSTVTECFLQIPQLITFSPYRFNVVNKSVHIDFINNHALMRGSTLYGGLLDRCTHNPFNEIINTHLNTTNGLQYLMEFSNINSTDSISSDPVRVCFCHNDKPDCTYQPPTINITKGEAFPISLVAVDQANHMISATIHSYPKSNESGISEGQLLQNAANDCSDLTYNVFSPRNDEELVIFADGPCKDAPLSQRSIHIKFLPCIVRTCPVGFQPKLREERRCACECDSKLDGYVTECNFKTQTLVRQGQPWISYVQTEPTNFSDYIIYPYCPLNYCKDDAELNLNTPNGVDAQCATFRTRTLCGACQPRYSLSLGSSHCLKCPSYWPAMFVIILVASFLAGIALVATLLVLNLTVAVGTLNGIIFYANIVYANIHAFCPDTQSSFITVFISWMNFDIGIDTCLFEGMNAYWKTWLQLVFPLYVFFLVIMVIVISEQSKRFSELIGKKNPVATLATLIQLSYAKLLHVIITALSIAVLNYPGPNGGYERRVWLPDATVDYFKGKHVPLFLAAIFILLVGVVYTALLFSWQWLLRCNKGRILRWTRNPKVSLFIETYNIPYTPQNRYWTGLLLFVRITLYIASAANVSGDPKINLLTVGSVIAGVLLISKIVGISNRIYKKWPIEVLEVASYMNLLLLCLATFFSLGNRRARKAVINISVSFTFLLLLCILFYHIFTELIIKPWKKAIGQTRPSVEQSEGDSEMSAATSTVVDAPKKILCTNYVDSELRETLLDYSDI